MGFLFKLMAFLFKLMAFLFGGCRSWGELGAQLGGLVGSCVGLVAVCVPVLVCRIWLFGACCLPLQGVE